MSTKRSRLPVVWSPEYEVDIGPHVFPTAKYRRVRERLLEDGVSDDVRFIEPAPASREDVALVHDQAYLEKIERGAFSPSELGLLELPFSPELRDASYLCCGGSIVASELAVEEGVSVHLGGGFHHAFADHGEGFCLLNDVAVAARVVRARERIERVAIVDLDVHHGNGTAAIFAEDPSVFTFSMHQERNYPAVKPPGDLDIGLADGTGDDEFIDLLEENLARALKDHHPALVIYLAGADPYHEDQLGGLALTVDGLARRDRLVFRHCRDAGIAVCTVPAGGYALRTDDTVEIHANTVKEAVRIARRP